MRYAPFIVLESCDGGGSTTQRDLLVARLESNGVKTFSTAQPSKGPAGRLIRDMLTGRCSERMDPEAFQRLFVADRVDHLVRVVEPARASGHTVICDRGELSTVVYYAAGAAHVRAMNERSMDALAWHLDIEIPTLTIVLAVPAEVAADRRRARGGPEELFDEAAFQERVARLYADIEDVVGCQSGHRYRGPWLDGEDAALVVIDGTGTVDEVAASVWAAVESRIGTGA